MQAVCSPIRNPLARRWRFATAALSYGVAGPLGILTARSAKVPDQPFRWKRLKGPWFDNNLATLQADGRRLWIRWERGEPAEQRKGLRGALGRRTVDRSVIEQPKLELVREIRVDG